MLRVVATRVMLVMVLMMMMTTTRTTMVLAFQDVGGEPGPALVLRECHYFLIGLAAPDLCTRVCVRVREQGCRTKRSQTVRSCRTPGASGDLIWPWPWPADSYVLQGGLWPLWGQYDDVTQGSQRKAWRGTSGGIEGWADLEQRQALLKSRRRRYKKQQKINF